MDRRTHSCQRQQWGPPCALGFHWPQRSPPQHKSLQLEAPPVHDDTNGIHLGPPETAPPTAIQLREEATWRPRAASPLCTPGGSAPSQARPTPSRTCSPRRGAPGRAVSASPHSHSGTGQAAHVPPQSSVAWPSALSRGLWQHPHSRGVPHPDPAVSPRTGTPLPSPVPVGAGPPCSVPDQGGQCWPLLRMPLGLTPQAQCPLLPRVGCSDMFAANMLSCCEHTFPTDRSGAMPSVLCVFSFSKMLCAARTDAPAAATCSILRTSAWACWTLLPGLGSHGAHLHCCPSFRRGVSPALLLTLQKQGFGSQWVTLGHQCGISTVAQPPHGPHTSDLWVQSISLSL